VETGPTAEVLLSPKHPYTKALLSVVPEINKLEPVILVGETPDPSRIPAGCRFRPRCPAYAAGLPSAVASRCETEAPAVLPADRDHSAACHLTEAE
jgi:peptide/nickel transport system ATP-binding protein